MSDRYEQCSIHGPYLGGADCPACQVTKLRAAEAEVTSLRDLNAELAGASKCLEELEAAVCRVELISWRISQDGPPKLAWTCLVYAKERRGETLIAQTDRPYPYAEAIQRANTAARAALAKHKETQP